MVSWGRAFKAALVLLAFSILWGIIGGAIIFAGTFFGALEMVQFVPYPPYIILNLGAIGVIIVIWVIGALIVFLGRWASILKIAVELAAEEISATMRAAAASPVTTQAAGAPTPPCPKCGNPLTYVQQYQRWYCHTCKEYQ